MGIVIIAGRALIALVAQPRLKQEEVPCLEVIENSVLLQIHIPVTDHIQDILVDRPGKVDPRLGVVDPPQHPYTGKQICIVRQKHRHSSSCTHTAVQQRTSGSFTV